MGLTGKSHGRDARAVLKSHGRLKTTRSKWVSWYLSEGGGVSQERAWRLSQEKQARGGGPYLEDEDVGRRRYSIGGRRGVARKHCGGGGASARILCCRGAQSRKKKHSGGTSTQERSTAKERQRGGQRADSGIGKGQGWKSEKKRSALPKLEWGGGVGKKVARNRKAENGPKGSPLARTIGARLNLAGSLVRRAAERSKSSGGKTPAEKSSRKTRGREMT